MGNRDKSKIHVSLFDPILISASEILNFPECSNMQLGFKISSDTFYETGGDCDYSLDRPTSPS